MEEVKRLTVDVPEAAKLLGISKGTAYTAIQEGRLPGIRVSARRVVISAAYLNKLLEGNDNKAAS